MEKQNEANQQTVPHAPRAPRATGFISGFAAHSHIATRKTQRDLISSFVEPERIKKKYDVIRDAKHGIAENTRSNLARTP